MKKFWQKATARELIDIYLTLVIAISVSKTHLLKINIGKAKNVCILLVWGKDLIIIEDERIKVIFYLALIFFQNPEL